MKSLRSLIRRSALTLMAGLLLVFSVLIYVGGDALLRRFVDGRLLGLAGTLAKIVEQHPTFPRVPVRSLCSLPRAEATRFERSGETPGA